jgi:chemotaxis protein MotA
MRMLIDGLEIEEIKSTAEAAMAQVEQKLSTEVSVWETLGDLFPAFGMIGTLIGLIQMLQNLSDPSALGPGMAVAMITTLYGAILANTLCIPISKKLKYYKDLKLLFLEAYLLTAEAIEKGVNPNILRQKLASLFGVEVEEG